MRLEKGWFLDLRIQEKGVEVEVSLADAHGAPLATASPGSQDHRDLLLWVTGTSGEYRLAVHPRDPSKPPGKYRIEIRELRLATDRDGARVAALKLVRQGLQEIEEEKTRSRGHRSLEQALLLWRQAGDAEGEVDTFNHLGRGFRLAGNAREACRWYERALTRAQQAGYREGEALSLNNLAYASHNLLKEDRGVPDLYERSIALWKEIGDDAEQAFVLINLGNFYVEVQKYDEAHAAFARSRPLAEALGDLGLQGKYWAGVAYAQYFQSDLQASFQSYRRAFDFARAAGDMDTAATIASSLASVYTHLGRLQEAVEFPLEIQEQVREPESRGYLLHNLAGVYLSLGKSDEALAAYQEAFAIFRNLGAAYRDWAAQCLIGIGSVLQRRGDPETALLKYQEAHALAPELAIVTQHLGLAYLDLRKPEQALQFFKRALKSAEHSDNQNQVGLTRLALAAAYRDLGQLDAAAWQLDQGYELASRTKNTGQVASFLLRRAMLRRDAGRLAEAQADVEQALGIIESMRQNVLGQDLQMSFFASRRVYQELHIDLLMRLDRLHPGKGYQAQALAASERARARGLLDLLSESKISLGEEVDPALAQQEASLSATLSRVQASLREERLAALPDGEKIRTLEREVARWTESRERLEWEIRKRQPNPQIHPLDLPAIQRELDDRSVLLEYALGEEGSFLFVVTRDGLETRKLPDAATLRERVLRLREAIKRNNPRKRQTYLDEAHQLYRDLLEPVAGALEGKENLLIAPDGALHLLPFEVLLTEPGEGSFKDLPYLLRSHAVTYVPSASVLAQLRQPRTEPPAAGRLHFVAFADPDYGTKTKEREAGPRLRSLPQEAQRWYLPPLPDSRREVADIARLYRGSSKLYLESEANEENVKSNDLVERAERLHFATHARPDERRPELSSLILADEKARNGEEDGLLQAHEIFRLKLSADLVVLSACETGLGEEVSGEGLVGLSRSFLYAGAPSLVVSLWSVSDGATPDLMVSFYEGLDRRHDKADALRRAKLQMIGRSRYAHPSYWAPFILIGDPR
ncbi:MAG TPA: CHAT domain-containing protein [Thermoanaerobaculia bacterium]|nr:CHAT domain-containing protein [Thermoanaerobaculia bacterium]